MPDKRGNNAGKSEQGEEDEGDQGEDHSEFTLPGFRWQSVEYLTSGRN